MVVQEARNSTQYNIATCVEIEIKLCMAWRIIAYCGENNDNFEYKTWQKMNCFASYFVLHRRNKMKLSMVLIKHYTIKTHGVVMV